MDAVGSERALVWGFEDGCAVSLLFAASRPERTLGLVLVAPSVSYWKTEEYPWGFSEDEARHWDERIENAWGTVEFWRENAADLQADTTEEILEHLARWSRLCVSPQAALAIEQVQRQLDVRSLLPEIRVPTLVMQKEGDRVEDRTAGSWVAEQIPGARFVELPGKTHFILPDDGRHFEELDRFVAAIREEQAELDRVLATVLFTDIVESTQHAVELGDRAWRELLERHHATVRSILARYRGHEVDTAGDGFFATFDGPARAVRCAQQIAGAVRPLGLEIRAGVHTGEVQMIDGKAGGLGVVIGARVGALAAPSEVLVSQTVKDLVAGSGLVFEDRGLQQLKGVPDEWRVYAAN
jgi:class 3 adenylate cyclase